MLLVGGMLLTQDLCPLFGVQLGEEGVGFGGSFVDKCQMDALGKAERLSVELANVQGKLVFSREGDCIWQCHNCGHICVGKQAPEVCPVCDHPQALKMLKSTSFFIVTVCYKNKTLFLLDTVHFTLSFFLFSSVRKFDDCSDKQRYFLMSFLARPSRMPKAVLQINPSR